MPGTPAPDDPRRCQKHKTNGDPCTQWAMKGQTCCYKHGGASPQARAKAQERVALQEAQRMVRIENLDQDPAAHLLDSLLRVTALALAYGDASASLDEEGRLTTDGGWLHAYPTEYRRLLTERARIAKLCLDARIDDRRVRLAEQQAVLIADYTRALLSELGIDPASDKARVAMRRNLSLIAGGAA